MRLLASLLAVILPVSASVAATAPVGKIDPASAAAPPSASKPVSNDADRLATRGGSIRLIWNDNYLQMLGLPRITTGSNASKSQDGSITFQLARDTVFEFDARGQSVVGLAGGAGRVLGEVRFKLGSRTVMLTEARMLLRPGAAPRIDFMSKDGDVLFYADAIMYEFPKTQDALLVRTGDLRIAPALAQRMSHPDANGAPVAELAMRLPLVAGSQPKSIEAAGDPNWPNEAVTGTPGAFYQADVFMSNITISLNGCSLCDGPATGGDGQVKFTPSSTLVNNRNNGSAMQTVSDPVLGTSTALYASDVPWWQKFTTSNPLATFDYPYHLNDQHPYLIWNLYRLDSNGAITQIGRSGVKHAFVSTNQPGPDPCDGVNTGHVLGRSCSDTYAVSNNNSNSSLGPRSEIVPALGKWGRCGSIYDLNCDQVESPTTPNTDFQNRLLARETMLAPAVSPGTSTLLFESWYIVRDDINIYNTMATRPITVAWSGSAWSSTTQSPFRLGPAINRWVDPATVDPTMRNNELIAEKGHTQVAVKVLPDSGNFRYEYAVMNHDFAREVTTGIESDHTYHVVSNNGFNSFFVPTGSGVVVSQTAFNDGDTDTANDWVATVAPAGVTWQAPNAAASLNWGTMFRFTVVANATATASNVTLGITEPGTPASYDVSSLGVAAAVVTPLLIDGFEGP